MPRSSPSLEELAEAARAARGYRKEGDDMLWKSWVRPAMELGIAAVLVFMLLPWLQNSVDRKLDQTVEAAQATQILQGAMNKVLSDFVAEQTRQNEIMLLVQRQVCANGAKTDAARDQCYVATTRR